MIWFTPRQSRPKLPHPGELIVHVDASQIEAANDTPLATIPNLGTGMDATQATADKRAVLKTNVLNGLPVIRADGVDDGYRFALLEWARAQHIHVYAVMSVTATGDRMLLESTQAATANNGAFYISRNADLKLACGLLYQSRPVEARTLANHAGGTEAFHVTTFRLLHSIRSHKTHITVDGTQRNTYHGVNGSDSAAAVVAPSAFSSFETFLFSRGNASQFFGGDLAELRVYIGAPHTADTRNAIEAELAAKWGVNTWAPSTADIVFDGASNTNGDQVYLDVFPIQVMNGLTGRYQYQNTGVNGRTVGRSIWAAPYNVQPFMPRVVPGVIVVQHGSNDMAAPGAYQSAETVAERLREYCLALRRAGWGKVLICTVTPRADGSAGAEFESRRLALNVLLRAEWGEYADALIDYGNDAALQDPENLTYFNADKVHWTAAGNAVVAGHVTTALATLGIT